MNIEQVLRDCINSTTCKILKDEYGIDIPDSVKEKIAGVPKDKRRCYQVVLMDNHGRGREIVDYLKAMFGDFASAKVLTLRTPSVIRRCLNEAEAVDVRDILISKGADAIVEQTMPL